MQRGCQRCARLVQQARRRRGQREGYKRVEANEHAGVRVATRADRHVGRQACGVREREGTQ